MKLFSNVTTLSTILPWMILLLIHKTDLYKLKEEKNHQASFQGSIWDTFQKSGQAFAWDPDNAYMPATKLWSWRSCDRSNDFFFPSPSAPPARVHVVGGPWPAAKSCGAAHCLCPKRWGRDGRAKARKLAGWDKDSLVSEGNKTKQTTKPNQNKQCKGSHWLVTASKNPLPCFLLLTTMS